MKEFGSDFHLIEDFGTGLSLLDIYQKKNPIFFASGRQCLLAIAGQHKWRRMWVPQYFCYDVVRAIEATGIEVAYYLDFPGYSENQSIDDIRFKSGDALLRVNYFGGRLPRLERQIPVPVIEDHSHSLLGSWALSSDSDWCIASLRKSLPLAEGGMLWSPKGLSLEALPLMSDWNVQLAMSRWSAMAMKRDYLCGKFSNKEMFRDIFIKTEQEFDRLPPTSIDARGMCFLRRFDVEKWEFMRKENWRRVSRVLKERFEIFSLEDESCSMFSVVVLAKNFEEREAFKRCLIKEDIYPAVLWNVPENCSRDVFQFSSRMLSIHCDARYTGNDIEELITRLTLAMKK